MHITHLGILLKMQIMIWFTGMELRFCVITRSRGCSPQWTTLCIARHQTWQSLHKTHDLEIVYPFGFCSIILLVSLQDDCSCSPFPSIFSSFHYLWWFFNAKSIILNLILFPEWEFSKVSIKGKVAGKFIKMEFPKPHFRDSDLVGKE